MNRNVRSTSATATVAAAAVVVWLALPAGLQAKPSFANVAGGTITQGPSKLNITVVNNDTLKGEVQIPYRVTAGDVRGNVILKMKFVGARVPASPP